MKGGMLKRDNTLANPSYSFENLTGLDFRWKLDLRQAFQRP